MKTLDEAHLARAASDYAVANTPLFLIRKLREDPVVHEISNSFRDEEILAAFRQAVEVEPQTAEDYVRPYVFLVALALKPRDICLRAAAQVPHMEKWDWLEYVQRVLVASYVPTISETLRVQQRAASEGLQIRTDAPVESVIIKLS